MDDLDARDGVLKRSVTMDVYNKLGDQSMLKLYRIARQCGDFATANAIREVLKARESAVTA